MFVVAILAVSSTLLIGAAWGIFAPPGDRAEGVFVALAGGALLIAAILELIEPAIPAVAIAPAMISVLAGAALYTTLAYLRCFSAGAIICALATDVFPKAFTNNHYLSGIATAAGVVLALSLNRL